MARWIALRGADSIPDGQGRTLAAGTLRLAVFNDGGEILAIDDVCPHQGASLGEGLMHDGRVICPWHSWVFDLRSGACPRDSHEPVQTYPVRRSPEGFEVGLPDDHDGDHEEVPR